MKNNRTVIIIVVVLLVLCCCCLVIGFGGNWLWNNGDKLLESLGTGLLINPLAVI